MIRVSIRPLMESDADVSWEWRNNPEVWKFTGSRPDREITPEIERNWIRKVLADPTTARFAIVAEENGKSEYVGNVQLTDLTSVDAQYHIFIGNVSFWGKGVGRIATRLILEHAFDTLRLRSVWLMVRKNNLRAIELYRRTGFTVKEEKEEEFLMEITPEALQNGSKGNDSEKCRDRGQV